MSKRASVFSVFAEVNKDEQRAADEQAAHSLFNQGSSKNTSLRTSTDFDLHANSNGDKDDRKYHTLSAGKARAVLVGIKERQETQANQSIRRIKKAGYDKNDMGTWSKVHQPDGNIDELIEYLLETLRAKDEDLALAAEMGQTLLQEQADLMAQLEAAEQNIQLLNHQKSELEQSLVQQQMTLNVDEDEREVTAARHLDLDAELEQVKQYNLKLATAAEEAESKLKIAQRENADLKNELTKLSAEHKKQATNSKEHIMLLEQQLDEITSSSLGATASVACTMQLLCLTEAITKQDLAFAKSALEDQDKTFQQRQNQLSRTVELLRAAWSDKSHERTLRPLDRSSDSLDNISVPATRQARSRSALGLDDDDDDGETDNIAALFQQMQIGALGDEIKRMMERAKRFKAENDGLKETLSELQVELDLLRKSKGGPMQRLSGAHNASNPRLEAAVHQQHQMQTSVVPQMSVADEIHAEIQFAHDGKRDVERMSGYEYFHLLVLKLRIAEGEIDEYKRVTAPPAKRAKNAPPPPNPAQQTLVENACMSQEDLEALFRHLIDNGIPFTDWEDLLRGAVRAYYNMQAALKKPNPTRTSHQSRIQPAATAVTRLDLPDQNSKGFGGKKGSHVGP